MSRATFTKIESPTLPKNHPTHTVYAARVGNTEFRIARDGKGWCVDKYEMGIWERASETFPTLTAAKAAFKHETSKLRRNPRRHNPSIYTSAAAAKRAGYGNTGYTKTELLALLRKRAKENDTDGALVIAAEAVAKGADPHVVDSIFRGSSLAIEGTHGNPRRRNPGKFTDIRDHKHYNLYIGTFTAKKRPTKADLAGTFLHREHAEQAAAEILAELDPGFADVRIVEVKPRKK